MGKGRNFTTIPARALADTQLSALDLRCLGVISMHDGMSLLNGKGAGCFASHATLAAKVQTDISNFSKSLSKLVRLGYILREPQQMDRRRFTLRVIFSETDTWRNDQTSPDEEEAGNVGETTNHANGSLAKPPTNSPEIVGDAKSQTPEVSTENGMYYIPLNGELHSVKTEELDSPEGAHRENRDARGKEEVDFINAVFEDLSRPRIGRNQSRGKNSAEAGLRRKVSIREHLPSGDAWNRLSQEAKLCRIEDALKRNNWNVDAWDYEERVTFEAYLFEVADSHAGDPAGYQAGRILDEIELRSAA